MAQREGQALNLQAAAWLAKLQRDELEPADRAELQRWLETDPAHAVAFARAEFAWERAERLRAFVPQAESPKPRIERRTWAIAAAIVLALSGAVAAYRVRESNGYSTAVGERRSIALEDGSQVQLNTASRVELAFDRQTRTVSLKRGEALFKVVHDAQRPFVVLVGKTVVRAIGTAFDVRIRDNVVEVTVTEGVVAVNDDKISAGSAAIVAAGTVNRVELQEDAMARRVAWRDGVIELRGETLTQAVEEFNRYRKAKLIIADPAIAELHVGGRFETDESQKFLSGLEINFGVRVASGEGGVQYLFGRGN